MLVNNTWCPTVLETEPRRSFMLDAATVPFPSFGLAFASACSGCELRPGSKEPVEFSSSDSEWSFSPKDDSLSCVSRGGGTLGRILRYFGLGGELLVLGVLALGSS